MMAIDLEAPRADDDLDATLLRGVADGDSAAFDELFQRYYPLLRRFLWRFCSDDAIDEVTSDTLLTVWRKARGFEGRSRVSTWIFGIAYRRALKAASAARRHDRARSIAIDPPDTSSDTARHETAQWVDQALDRLPAKQRAVVELTFFADLSYPEIAEIVGCPVGTVKTRMHKAKQTLKPALDRLATTLSLGGRHD
ncbi:MAG: RNA polymerase sigma factor [Pseudomonadota bacterium]